ncbi:hypothetical protein ACIP2Y_44420 [Streptomyces sviceus]
MHDDTFQRELLELLLGPRQVVAPLTMRADDDPPPLIDQYVDDFLNA